MEQVRNFFMATPSKSAAIYDGKSIAASGYAQGVVSYGFLPRRLGGPSEKAMQLGHGVFPQRADVAAAHDGAVHAGASRLMVVTYIRIAFSHT